jgi:tetratricopeptide (TPR) repeat protein
MSDIFISYTSSDRDWAFWLAKELQALGHTPHVHEWEIAAGGNIMAWMVERHDAADHILCVVSQSYLEKPYSSLERQAAEWAAASERPNFALPVFVEQCKPPTLFATLKRCDLYGLSEEDARASLKAFLAPVGGPTEPPQFPGVRTTAQTSAAARAPAPFPRDVTLSNIPISIPRHFVGRDEALEAIATALASSEGRAAVTTLHGLRGVGKTTLAAAYAERHRGDYRATWWIRAQTPDGMRADLVALGVRLGWVAAEEKEQPAFKSVIERLRDEGGRILLIYDNAINADELRPYLPLSGAARVLITSNAPGWRAIADPVEIRVWQKEIGADYLIARTGRKAERAAAEALSDVLGGLPLAHEQAAAYCERLEVPLGEYQKRFKAAPARLLDDDRDAPREYHDRTTVTKTFALAIDEASKLHSAAEPLIVYAALLAPEPIPLFLFAEAREKLGEPLPSLLVGDGLDEAVAALRAFALVDRESIVDERDPTITTDCIRIHRLVRQMARARREGEARETSRRNVIEAMAAVYPNPVFEDPASWPRARRLDALAMPLVGGDETAPQGSEGSACHILDRLASYRHGALAAYAEARRLFERALAIREKVFGPDHPNTAASVNNFALVLQGQGDLAGARPLLERALAINEKVLGSEHPGTAVSLNNLALLLQEQGDLAAARPLCERALTIYEALGPERPDTATSLNNLALLLQAQGDLAAARPLYERALAIYEKALGPGDPRTSRARGNFARLLLASGDASAALAMGEAALAAHHKVLGQDHPWTELSARVTTDALDALGRGEETAALRERYGVEGGGKQK